MSIFVVIYQCISTHVRYIACIEIIRHYVLLAVFMPAST